MAKDKYFEWEGAYMAAALETDNRRLTERIQVAEETLMRRFTKLSNREEHERELRAIENAVTALAGIKRERLGL